MKILGITAPISENTAACVLMDGELVAFVEEERFVGIKHAPKMVPKNAVQYCLKTAGLTIDDIDIVAVGFLSPGKAGVKNLITNILEGNWSRVVRETGAYIEYATSMFRQVDFLESLSKQKNIKQKIRYVDHHTSHVSSAVRCAGFEDAIVMSLDGVGEDNAGMVGNFKDGKINKYKNIPINQSLGWLYGEVTSICGFKSHSHEGKTMGLAAYGIPDLKSFEGIAELNDDGYFLTKNFASKLRKRFKKREPHEAITQYHKDLAATVQKFLEEAVLRLGVAASKKFKSRNLALAGGVALNCDMNFRLSASGCFDNIFIQPASNDAGTALGASLEQEHLNRNKISTKPSFVLKHAQYGPSYPSEEIELLLKESKISYRRYNSVAEIAKLINDGKIVAWFKGRMEFGPRALGGRSILANPSLVDMREKINIECKHRENWRPFAPSVLSEYCDEYFENYHPSPIMLMTFKVKKQARDKLAATVHIDDTARVQDVRREDCPEYYDLIDEFRKLSGVAALLDTSFNDKEKPIALSPRDAIQTFFTTGIDVLVLEDFILTK